MRSITRQSVRLARSNSRVREHAYIAHFPAQSVRRFHGSFRASAEPQGSDKQNDHHKSPDARHEERVPRKEDTASVEKDVDNIDPQPVGDTPNLRRTLRQRRIASDTPKPPPIPAWFLAHSVKLHSESIEPDHLPPGSRGLTCTDRTNGRTLLVFPHHQNETPKDEESDEINFFDSYGPQAATPSFESLGDEGDSQGGGYDTLLRWTLLEIETGIRAAFTLPGRAQSASSYVASNVDISLLCPHSGSHARLDELVEDLATLTNADLIRFDANDLADLTSEYVGQGLDSPGWFSTLGYEVFDRYTSTGSGFSRPEEEEDDDDRLDEYGTTSNSTRIPSINLGTPKNMDELRKALHDNRHELAKALGGVPIQGIAVSSLSSEASIRSARSEPASRLLNPHGSTSWDEARLRVLLDSLLDAPSLKRAQGTGKSTSELQARIKVLGSSTSHHADWPHPPTASLDDPTDVHDTFRALRSEPRFWFPAAAHLLVGHLKSLVPRENVLAGPIQFSHATSTSTDDRTTRRGRRIVHVRDLLDICQSPVGTAVVRRLIRVVQKRRRAGEEIILIGTSGQETSDILVDGQQEHEGLPLRHLVLPPFFVLKPGWSHTLKLPTPTPSPSAEGYHRILEINLRHIQSMLSRLRPSEEHDLFTKESQQLLNIRGTSVLSERVLSFEYVHRIVLTAIGLSQAHAVSEHIIAPHIGMATLITSQADAAVNLWSVSGGRIIAKDSPSESTAKPRVNPSETEKARARVDARVRTDELKKICNPYETRLLSGVVDPENIKTSFDEVHAPPNTIEALKTLTSLSLTRPDAFKYGILAKDRLTGLMLYGPPGTGKTLLAKAVAKESQSTVLEVSGAQIYEKYVGEGEKMVSAVFSLARKLSPCIVFIDEADSIFGARKSGGNRNSHREIINQFLREWDGMGTHDVFMMVASNRPFDLDDAVLRRVPRRLLVDLPVAKDRESILNIHLKNEQLDASVSVATLAGQTPLYSGSDLKNVCVAAALACVREENELLNQNKDDENFKLPERRTLTSRHFEKALGEINASIGENMDSLTAIRRFDEEFGDRRGKRSKTAYGFGLGDQDVVDESAARVRQTGPPPP